MKNKLEMDRGLLKNISNFMENKKKISLTGGGGVRLFNR
jgi:hypothetical protein